MIKVENGQVELKGNPVDLCTDLAVAIRGTIDAFEKSDMPREMAVDLVKKSVELGLKSSEELRKEAREKIGELFMFLFDEILGDEE